jgi:hypothetical protein
MTTQPEHSVPDLDLGALERAARAATDGEWWADRVDGATAVIAYGHRVIAESVLKDADAAHIAAWSPATALRVLAELRAARDAAADAVEGR